MEGPLYSSIRHKHKNTIKKDLSRFSLIEQEKLLAENPDIALEWKAEEVRHAYYNDLKSLLEKNELSELIGGLFELEHVLSLIEGSPYSVEVDHSDFPSLKNFYQQLAPVLLRALREIKNNETNNLKNEQKSNDIWKEAIRIAIEEEIYIWQEEILN